MSNKLDDLDPDVRALAEKFLMNAAKEGILLRVTQTYRTPEEQALIYAKGRTAAGEPCMHAGGKRAVGTCSEHPLGRAVTNAPPGYSWHEFRRAFDVAERDGTPYDLGAPGPQDDDPLWEKLANLGEACGLEAGFRWKHPDRPHFQDTGGMTLAAMRANAAEAANG